MKKLFFALCVCAGLCACSSDDDLVSSSSTATQDGTVAYLTVNLKDVNSSTRATDGGFAYGTTAEQTVNNAYFYFYNDEGTYMAKGSLGEVSGTASTSTDPSVGDIEWQSNTIVAVYGLEDVTNLPTRMLTVLNKPSGVDLTNQTFAQATATLAGTPYGNSDGSFVMSTSVYESGDPAAVVNYTALDESNFATEPVNIDVDYGEDGDATPVEVYVERLAAKVTVTDGVTTETDGYINITENVAQEFANGAPAGGVFVKLDGFNVDAVARDAYLVKNVTDFGDWTGFSFVWNGANNYRCYWAESPNHGETHAYPTSSLGNTDADEDTTPLDSYLRYVSLNDANTLKFSTDAAYCGENTNTAEVLVDASSTGITNLLVRGQVYTHPVTDGEVNEDTYEELSLVEFHGMYYTVEDFLQKTVDDVVEYDFTIVVDEVIAALEDSYSTLTSAIELLNDAIIKDHIYKSKGTGHKFVGENSATLPTEVTAFGGEMLTLYNDYDGNVKIFYRDAQPYWGESGTSDGTPVGSEIIAKYPDSAIVYPAVDDALKMSDYDFWFKVDSEKFNNALLIWGLTAANIMCEIPAESGNYYMPIDNGISFESQAIGDNDTGYTGKHTYTTRNYLLRAITVEADGIDTQFGSHYPNLFNNGYMYYNVPIEHLNWPATGSPSAFAEAQYGIVRNHLYNININSLTNFGRGIADLNEVIVPQPEVTYYYLGADINILSWKMVNQTVNW